MKLKTGSEVLDELLEGGFETDILTILYGPGSTGKTNFCLLTALANVSNGKKAIYIDTEGGTSFSRFKQLQDFKEESINNILFLKPTTFNGQQNAFEKLKEMITDQISIIIIDSIAMLYRYELTKKTNKYDLNQQLSYQIGILVQIARKYNIPVIITNQVYSKLDTNQDNVMIGGDFLTYQSKCIIELAKDNEGNRRAILKKHRSIPEGTSIDFVIEEKGIYKK
jgi:DNA repair protein RadB